MRIEDFASLPGAELIAEGRRDLAENCESVAALLVRIGRPRLERIGFDIPAKPVPDGRTEAELPEHRLYHLLATEDTDAAHSRYNSLIRRLVSFARAAECAIR